MRCLTIPAMLVWAGRRQGLRDLGRVIRCDSFSFTAGCLAAAERRHAILGRPSNDSPFAAGARSIIRNGAVLELDAVRKPCK